MPETVEISEIKTPLATIIKKIGTFDSNTEFYSEETPFGNPLIPEFNTISKVNKICRMTGVYEEKWSKIEKEKYSDYKSALVADNEYSGLISLDAMYICNLIDRGKYADASYMAIQIGADIHLTRETLPEDYIRDDLDPNEALGKLREHLDRSLSDGKRKIALAFMKKGQIEKADAVRGDPAILSPIDYLHYTLSYIRYYDSVDDFTSAQKYVDDITTRWNSDEHGGLPNYMRIPIDDVRSNHFHKLFENGQHEEAFVLLNTIEDKWLRNRSRMELITLCIKRGLTGEAERLSAEVLSDVSEKIDPAIVGMTLPMGQHQDYFDDVRLLTSLAICVADQPGLKHIYEKCIEGDENFPGALTRMKVIGGDMLQIEWVDMFRALGKVSDYERMFPLYGKLRSKLTDDEKDMLDGEYAIVLMDHDADKAHHIISSIVDLGLRADYLRVYIFQLLEKGTNLSGWQQWAKELKEVEELNTPDTVDFSTFAYGEDDMRSSTLYMQPAGVALMEEDIPSYGGQGDEQRYYRSQLKELLPNLALLAVEKEDLVSFDELLNCQDMANDYAVEVTLRVADHLYHKAELKYLY